MANKKNQQQHKVEDIIDDINELMKEIEDAKQEHSTKQGQVETLLDNLKEEFDVNSLEEVQELLKKLEEQRDKKMEKLAADYKKLRADYDW